MKFVDAEITQESEGAPDIARPPRPARRRVYTSLLVTLTVLVGTVAIIYSLFPNRDNEVLSTAMEVHRAGESGAGKNALVDPTGLEIRAWSLGIFDETVPWPQVDAELVPRSASVVRLFKRPMAIVRYELAGEPVSVAFWRARDAPPRVHRRREDGLYAVSWRRKRFTCIVVGPAASKDAWSERFGAP